MAWRDALQEVIELGASRTAWRVWWEAKNRSGAARLVPVAPAFTPAAGVDPARTPWSHPDAVRERLVAVTTDAARATLLHRAERALEGRVLCFGRWEGDWGTPVDWHRDPRTGARWPADEHWSTVGRHAGRVGDVKLTWEVARFPQAFHLARAAALEPSRAPRYAEGFAAMARSFLDASPYPLGVHWSSNQECAIRLHAWLFAMSVFRHLGAGGDAMAALARDVAAYAWRVGAHTEDEIGYARRAVYNNHLVTEAVALLLAAWCAPDAPEAPRWRENALATLTEEAGRQVYADGAYINLAHNYHRVVMQEYLLAWRFAGGALHPAWRAAMERSLTFLLAHQNPRDGRLPNYGANDGSLPRVLSTCDFSDFRPTLQCLSVAVRGERAYPPGPWDEECLWTLGPSMYDAPLRAPERRSVSFARTGFHVLRAPDPDTAATLRCGSVRDRFGQIDMLHVDATFRGHGVLVDGGTYLYNAEHRWHDHFLRTASHNTVTVDGRDQMLHHRRFKYLYWTEADLLRFEARPDGALAVGEHRGYARHPGGCVHRRAVLLAGERLVVVDTVRGDGRHRARLQWLCGDFEHRASPDGARVTLATPEGDWELAVLGEALRCDVVRGQETPPRGWSSRYYGERAPCPSLVAEADFVGEVTLLTVAGPGPLDVTREGAGWRVAGLGLCTIRDGAPRVEP